LSLQQLHAPEEVEQLARSFEDAPPQADIAAYATEDWLAFVAFWLMTLAVFAQFFTRYVLNDSFTWTEEVAIYFNVVVVFLGSALCVRLDRHIQVDFIYRYLPTALGRTLATLVDLIRICFLAYACVLTWRFIGIVGNDTMATIEVPKAIPYYGALFGVVMMLVRSIQIAIRNFRRGYSPLQRPDTLDITGST
jgi:TRAP-type C4-dicarboxylate transport system permease small subunit